ncbi:MAG: photosystem II protein Y [Cyanobacteria bacterium P01_F01_bin.53]
MQFIVREPKVPFQLEFLGIDSRVALVLLPLVLSVVWNVINYGKPTLDEIKRVLNQ